MASCIGFVFLTVIILVVFIIFPITPSEKVLASIGRENVANTPQNGYQQEITPVVDATEVEEEDVVSSVGSTVSTTARTVNIRITSGSGFLWNGRIPTGVMGGGSTTTTVVDEPDQPTLDPGYTDPDIPTPSSPETTEPGGDIPPATQPENPGVGGEQPPVEQPEPPIATDAPVVDVPVIPPETNPVVPPEDSGGDVGGGGGEAVPSE